MVNLQTSSQGTSHIRSRYMVNLPTSSQGTSYIRRRYMVNLPTSSQGTSYIRSRYTWLIFKLVLKVLVILGEGIWLIYQ